MIAWRVPEQSLTTHIRAVFAPFFQTCFLIGMAVGIGCTTSYHWFQVQPIGMTHWALWQKGLDSYLQSMIWLVALANSYVSGRTYLHFRNRVNMPSGFSPGTWACYVFVAMTSLETSAYLWATNPVKQSATMMFVGIVVNAFIVIFSSIAVLPAGAIVDRVLGSAYAKDETISKGRKMNARAH